MSKTVDFESLYREELERRIRVEKELSQEKFFNEQTKNTLVLRIFRILAELT